MPKAKSKRRHTPSRSKSRALQSSHRFSRLQMLIFVLLFAGIGTYLIYQGFAAPPAKNDFSWNRYNDNFLSPLDAQGSASAPVYNTTGCAWNDQDDITNEGRGNLSGSTTNTICMVADYDETYQQSYPKLIMFNVYAASDTLDVSLTNDAGSSWHAGPSVASGSLRLWQLCVNDPVADPTNVGYGGLGYWPEIPGTNGGRGKIVNYSLHLTSSKGTTRKVTAYFEIAHNGTIGPRRTVQTTCPLHDTPAQ